MGGEWTHLISSKQPVFALKTYASLRPRPKPSHTGRFCFWRFEPVSKWVTFKHGPTSGGLKQKLCVRKISRFKIFPELLGSGFYRQTIINHPTEGSKHFPASGHGTWYPVHASTRCLGRARMVLGPEMKGLCLTEAVLQNSKMIIYNQWTKWTKHRICLYIYTIHVSMAYWILRNITASEAKKGEHAPLKIDMDTWINSKTIILKESPFPNHRFWI